MTSKAIVLDANILIRAVLGKRVRELILKNAATVKFFAPSVAYDDAREMLMTGRYGPKTRIFSAQAFQFGQRIGSPCTLLEPQNLLLFL